jgi:tetratricopeptide (TPR) repeat protein
MLLPAEFAPLPHLAEASPISPLRRKRMDWSVAWQVLGAIGLTGAFSAWAGGYFGGFLPPPARLVRAVRNTAMHRRGKSPPGDDGRYHLVLCGLDGDDAREGTLRLLRGALNPQEYPTLRLSLSARCIRLSEWYAGKDPTAGATQAEAVLQAFKADAVLWGEVPKQGDSLRFFLRGAGRQETQIILFDKGLAKERPDSAIGPVLAAVALSQIAPATEESGRYLAGCLRPVAARLTALLTDLRLVPASERSNLHHALGLALTVIGEQAGDNTALASGIVAYRDALKEWARERAPLQWAMTQNNLGTALWKLGERESDTAHLEEAVEAYRDALKEWAREREPLQWAATQNNLGAALSTLGERESSTARLEEAIAACRDALKERTRERVPLDWAMTQHNLGAALSRLGQRESGTARLLEAVEAYRDALKERTRERMPLDWAATRNNLGNALSGLGEREGGIARLEEAVVAFRDALKEYTREHVPFQWAAMQNNLGNALSRLGQRESAPARLEEAVAAYRDALKEWTRERAPLQWATTQNNLGSALSMLGQRESGTARLEEAVEAYRDALKERTRELVPLDWARTQNNLGNAQALLNERLAPLQKSCRPCENPAQEDSDAA